VSLCGFRAPLRCLHQSTKPKNKGGDFYVIYLKRTVLLMMKFVDDIAILKSENKDTFFKRQIKPQWI
jgi:hypothetical protein